jgi:hypothetical protein
MDWKMTEEHEASIDQRRIAELPPEQREAAIAAHQAKFTVTDDVVHPAPEAP